MIRRFSIAVGLVAAAYVMPCVVFAQDSQPTYKADPSVYKLIFDDQHFRVIEGTWKAGQADKPHAHPVPSVVYHLTNCTIKLTSADGKTHIIKDKAGHANTVPITFSHSAKNISHHTCRSVFVEIK